MACSAGEYAQVENRGVVHKNPDNYQLGDELEFLGEIHDTNVSGLTIGSQFNVAKVFEEGTPEEVTLEFMKRWERPGKPHTDRRLKAAAELAASRLWRLCAIRGFC